jgi:WD40 repeat protein
LWDLATGRQATTLKGHLAAIYSVNFAADGRSLVSGSRDGTIRVWEIPTGKERATLKGHRGTVYAAAFAPDGKTLASGSEDGTVKLWDVGKILDERADK